MDKNKPVIQYSLEGIFIKTWRTLELASKETETLETDISLCCEGLKELANNFHWRYFDMTSHAIWLLNTEVISEKQIIQMDKEGNFIRDYPSVKIAAKINHIQASGLYAALNGKQKTCAGFTWRKGLTLDLGVEKNEETKTLYERVCLALEKEEEKEEEKAEENIQFEKLKSEVFETKENLAKTPDPVEFIPENTKKKKGFWLTRIFRRPKTRR